MASSNSNTSKQFLLSGFECAYVVRHEAAAAEERVVAVGACLVREAGIRREGRRLLVPQARDLRTRIPVGKQRVDVASEIGGQVEPHGADTSRVGR